MWAGSVSAGSERGLASRPGSGAAQGQRATCKASLSVVYAYEGLNRVERDVVEAGDIAAVAGVDDIFIGDTLGDLADPRPLPSSPWKTRHLHGVFRQHLPPGRQRRQIPHSRHIKERLDKELLYNVSIRVEQAENRDSFRVSARGELQLAVLVETMRREALSCPCRNPRSSPKFGRSGGRAAGAGGDRCSGQSYRDCYGNAKLPTRTDDQMINNGFGRVRLEFEIPTRV